MLVQQLSYLKDLVAELQNNNSTNEKKNILQKYFTLNEKLFCKFMDYIYSYDKKYWLTSENLLKNWDKFPVKNKFDNNDDIFKILDVIIDRQKTGHEALNYIIDLIKFLGDEWKDLIFYIINKDIKANINVSLINKIKPDIVKEFKVALAERNDEAPKSREVDFSTKPWMISRKLDGVRVVALNNSGEIELYSRTGTQFQTLDILKPEILKILTSAKEKYGQEYVLDGECCLIDEEGKDDFAGIMKQITRKNHQIKNPKYVVFDMVLRTEFDSANGTMKFGERMKKLEGLNIESFGSNVKLIQHQNSINDKDYQKWIDLSKQNNWEGLMLRDEESVYTGKRSFDLQKIKTFFDAEYEVIGIEYGNKKMLIDGIKKDVECVKSLVIEHDGVHMNVGSGMSDEERVEWFKNPNLIMNKIITVQYFEESVDSKTGKKSLRFPTLKVVHGEKREV